MNDFFEELEKAIGRVKSIQPDKNWSTQECRNALEQLRQAEEAVIKFELSLSLEGKTEETKTVEIHPQPTIQLVKEEEILPEPTVSIEEPKTEELAEQAQPENSEDEDEPVENDSISATKEHEEEELRVPTDKEVEEEPEQELPVEEEPIAEKPLDENVLKQRVDQDALSLGIQEGVELNERNKAEDNSLASRLRKSKITDLKASIGLNERFLFANELFNGNMEAFNRALNELNHIDSKDGADYFINMQLKERYSWNDESEVTLRFLDLVERRFL